MQLALGEALRQVVKSTALGLCWSSVVEGLPSMWDALGLVSALGKKKKKKKLGADSSLL
jgi:hypothetical protein